MGFLRGRASPCCFRHKEWGVIEVVQGNNFTALGTPSSSRKFGYTKYCQRCEYLRQSKLVLASGTRHSEECREPLRGNEG